MPVPNPLATSRPAPRSTVIALLGDLSATHNPASERPFDQALDRLAIGIVSGRYPSGSVLPNETSLGDAIAVSRTAYREAIKFLTAKGLIEAKPKSGTRVRPQSDWNLLDPDILRWSLQGGVTIAFVRDLFELRRCVEPDATRLAAQRRSSADLDAIRIEVERMESLPALTTPSIAADIAFHERIFEASGNRALTCLKSVVSTTVLWSLRIKREADNGAFTRSIAEHRLIYEAIVARDGELAAALSTTLITGALTQTEWALSQKADLSPDVSSGQETPRHRHIGRKPVITRR
jgi:GntR family transcriptional regulator, galactonate operon transcriptional repressor